MGRLQARRSGPLLLGALCLAGAAACVPALSGVPRSPAAAASARHLDPLGKGEGTTPGSTVTTLPPPTWPLSIRADVDPPVIPDWVRPSVALAWLERALTYRAGQLTALQEELAAKDLPASESAPLGTVLSTSLSGIEALQSSSAKDTTLAQVRTAASAMVVSFRVVSVVVPEVKSVLKAEAQLTSAGKLASYQPALRAAIAAERSSDSVGRLRTLYRDYRSRLAEVAKDQALVAQLLLVSPAQFPAASLELSLAAADLSARTTDLQVARHDLHEILAELAGPGSPAGSAVARRLP